MYDQDFLDYKRRISCYNILSGDEVYSLFEEMDDLKKNINESNKYKSEKRIKDIEEKLYKSCARLVTKVVESYINIGIPAMDLVSVGNEGLLIGIRRFDYKKGYALSTYVVYWIKQKITVSISDLKIIRLTVAANNELLRLNNQKKILQSKLNREPTIEELSDYSKVPTERIIHLFNVNSVGSLNVFVGEEENTEMIDLIEDYRINPEEQVMNDFTKKEIKSFFSEKLTQREQQIMICRYGLNGEMFTLEEVGRLLGITRERVRQIQRKTERRMGNNKKIIELV